MTYTQDNGLVELIKKIEILNSPLEKKEIKRDVAVLHITESSDNERTDRHSRILFAKDMDILKNNVIDIIKLLKKSVN